ncbi:hypothetical protein mRhiFer1_008242 [Rhinolophus ferrumequinum]|uniref:Uncharacterized protein n=1 Tax=Rhinolophus ferrumequinum TaxID=59479 RepID=A0A7J7VRA9_RHIFE|nr:hypothetical protein mRhiFer1_008242 [Rhinolophus ferrumequinum]
MGVPLYVTLRLSLAAFRILSLSLSFAILTIMCLGVDLFGLILVGTLCTSWTCMLVSFIRLGKFSDIITSNMFSIPCLLSSPSGIPMMRMLLRLMLSQRSLRPSSLFFILFSFCCSVWVISATLSSKSLIRSSASSSLLVIPSSEFLISVIVFFSSNWFFVMISTSFFMFSLSSFVMISTSFFMSSLSSLNILITSVLNSVSERLVTSASFGSSCGSFFCSFIWDVYLCFPILADCVYFDILGRSPRVLSSC